MAKNPAWAKNLKTNGRTGAWLSKCFVLAPLSWIFFVIDGLVPRRSKNVMLFVFPYAEFCENTRFLFEHCLKQRHESLQAVAFVYHRDLYQRLLDLYGNHVVYAKSFEGLRVFLKASLATTSRGWLARIFFPYFFHPRRKFFLNMWHGIPLKRLGTQSRVSWERDLVPVTQRYSALVSCSKIDQFAMALCFDMRIDDVWITNTPRNDLLSMSEPAPVASANTAAGVVPGKVILYAPTWRDGEESTELFPFDDFEFDALERLLATHDARLVIRRHVVERRDAKDDPFPGSRVTFETNSESQSVQQSLLRTDVLVTDYSSIFFDFLLLDRPIIFIPYDAHRYEARRGFMFDYDTVTPGFKSRTFGEFLRHLEESLSQPDAFALERVRVRELFHQSQERSACELITERLLSIRAADLLPGAGA
jgi:CDP-glycerol glycerophosphotransferase (TagB/SpsB family)